MPSRRGRRSGNAASNNTSSGATAAAVDTVPVCLPSLLANLPAKQASTKQQLVVEASSAPIAGSSWQKYPSIDDADLDQVRKIRQAAQGQEFVAVEKVHGSNFAFETNGRHINYFSRSRRLDASERFVGRTSPGDAMRQYHGPVMEAFRLCSSLPVSTLPSGEVTSVLIYGEYFGGWYPHEAVPQEGLGTGAPVQKGVVAYSPAHHFYAFDVCVDGEYLDFDVAEDLLTRSGFPMVAQALARGSFDECMAFDVEGFHTTIPGFLGLPLCEEYSIAEGVIVKPVRRRKGWAVKRKSVRYLEACPDELRKWMGKCADSPEEALRELYLCLCRRPRLDAVLSKDPQLRERPSLTLTNVQALFREDVEAELQKKLAAAKAPTPKLDLHALRAEADRRVADWLLGSEGKQDGDRRAATR